MDWATYENLLRAAHSDDELCKAIVNGPFADRSITTDLGLGIIVLLLVNEKTKTIDRVALSNTDPAVGAVRMSARPFHEIKIPLTEKNNILVKAVSSGKPQVTSDWQYLFTPVLTAQEARFNQFGAGIDHSIVYPLHNKQDGTVPAAIIFSYFELPHDIGAEHNEFMGQVVERVEQYLPTLLVK